MDEEVDVEGEIDNTNGGAEDIFSNGVGTGNDVEDVEVDDNFTSCLLLLVAALGCEAFPGKQGGTETADVSII